MTELIKDTIKRLLLPFLLLAFTANCTKSTIEEVYIPEANKNEVVETNKNPYLLTKDEALNDLIQLVSQMPESPSVRSGNKVSFKNKLSGITVKDIAQVSLSPIMTKGGEQVETNMYLVNFDEKNGGGYAMLAADKRAGATVLALVEKGNVKPEDFKGRLVTEADIQKEIPGFKFYDKEKDDYYVGSYHKPIDYPVDESSIDIEEKMSEKADEVRERMAEIYKERLKDEISREEYEEMLYRAEKEALKKYRPKWYKDTIIDNKKNIPGGGKYKDLDTVTLEKTTGWQLIDAVPAMLETKWHQNKPFNNLCPIRSQWGFGKMRPAPAGCVPIALAQIMAYHEFPKSFLAISEPNSNNEKKEYLEFDWKEVKKVCNYKEIYDCNDSTNNEKNFLAALLLKIIGDDVISIYRFAWAFGLPSDAKKFLEKVGYKNVELYRGKKLMKEKILEMLKSRKPVFIAAVSDLWDGHAWVIDGYQRYYDRTDYYSKFDKIISTSFDTKDYLHCNFGWGGQCDGYYSAWLFDLRDGPGYRDEKDFNYNYQNNYEKYNYDWGFRYITYDL